MVMKLKTDEKELFLNSMLNIQQHNAKNNKPEYSAKIEKGMC